MSEHRSRRELAKAIRREPKNAALRVERGDYYRERGRMHYASALTEYGDAIMLDANCAEAYFGRGLVRVQEGKYREAITDYEKATNLNPELRHPDFAKAYTSRGVYFADMGELEFAKIQYDKAIVLDPEFAEAYFRRGLAYALMVSPTTVVEDVAETINSLNAETINSLNKALEDFNTATGLNPEQDYLDALELICRQLAAAYSIKLARASARVEFDPEIVSDERAVISLCNKAIRINSESAAAYWLRGMAHDRKGITYEKNQEYDCAIDAYDKAIEDFTKGSDIDPGSVPPESFAGAYYGRGIAYDGRGILRLDERNYTRAKRDFLGALRDFVKAININSNPADAAIYYNSMGITRDNIGDFNGARDSFNKALELSKDPELTALIYNGMGVTYLRRSNPVLALEFFDKAIVNSSRAQLYHAQLYLNRGHAYADIGDIDRAIEDFDNAVRLCPNYKDDFVDKKYSALGASGVIRAIELLASVVDDPFVSEKEFDYYYTAVRFLFSGSEKITAKDLFEISQQCGSEYSAKVDRHLENLSN